MRLELGNILLSSFVTICIFLVIIFLLGVVSGLYIGAVVVSVSVRIYREAREAIERAKLMYFKDRN